MLVEQPRRGVSRPIVTSEPGLQTRLLTRVDLDTPAARATRSAGERVNDRRSVVRHMLVE
jgi:hypothetical protein